MSKRIGALLGLLLALLFAAAPALAEPQLIEYEWGWGGQALDDSWVPLKVTLISDTTVDGELVVSFTGDVDRYREIRVPTQLVAGQEKRLTVPVLNALGRPRLYFEVGGERFGETAVSARSFHPSDAALVGVISSDPGAARYLDLVQLGSPGVGGPGARPGTPTSTTPFSLRRHRLPATDLPEQPELLESFSMLLLARPGGSLSPGQQAALQAWVEAGGLLIVAGGPEAQANWASLPAEWRPQLGPLGPADQGLVQFLEAQGAAALPGDLSALAPFAGEQEPGAWYQAVGKGAVVALTFDPTLEPIASWQGADAYLGQLLGRLALEFPASRLGPQEYRYYGSRWSPYIQAMSQMPALELPHPLILFGLFAGYLLMVAPINYFVLKKLDKREWGWVTIPALSLIFTIAFIVISGPNRFAGTLTHPVSVTLNGQTKAYVGFYTTRQTNLSVELPPGSSALVKPYREMLPELGGAVLTLGSEPRVQFTNASAWGIQGAQFTQPTTLKGRLSLQGEIDTAQGVTVVVKNETEQVVRDAVVIVGDLSEELGDLQPSEERQVQLGVPSNFDTRVGVDQYTWRGWSPERVVKQDLVRGYAQENAYGLTGFGQLQVTAVLLGYLDEAPISALPEAGRTLPGTHLLVEQGKLKLSSAAAIPQGLLTFRPAQPGQQLQLDPGGQLQAEPGEHLLVLPLGAHLADLAGRSATLHWVPYGSLASLTLVGPDSELDLSVFSGNEPLGTGWTEYLDEFGNLRLKLHNTDWLYMPLPSLSFEGGGL